MLDNAGRLIDGIDRVAFEASVVRQYLGVPYVNGGRGVDGIDCWGLPVKIYEMAGVKLFDIPTIEYTPAWSKHGGNFLAENAWRDWEKVEKPEFLDGVLFKNVQGVAYHAGVVLNDGKFIHACMYGVIISRLTDAAVKDKIEGFYRLRRLYGAE